MDLIGDFFRLEWFDSLLITRLKANIDRLLLARAKRENFFRFFWRVHGVVGSVPAVNLSNPFEMFKGPKMIHKKFLFVAMFAAAITCLSTLDHKSAQADDDFFYLPIYKVQIKYIFWDTNYSHWTTVKTTSDYLDAVGTIFWLGVQRELGQFQQAADQLNPNVYWRYIPVDYRLVFEMQRIPVFFDSVKTLPGK